MKSLRIGANQMCGIVGYSGSFEPGGLKAASDVISHRGPDGHGMWHHPRAGIALAHRRLAIIDLSATGAQPMVSEDGALVIVYNGEIYNSPVLREELEAKGHTFRGRSDTEVLLHLYAEEGSDMLPRLNGIFAFALWNERRRELFVARDALGVKPLYYAQTSRGFAFASEIKALVVIGNTGREFDLEGIDRYLTFLSCPGEGTALRGVKKLQPGEAIVVSEGHIIRRWLWYRLPTGRSRKLSIDGEPGAVRDSLRRAVHRQMLADVPVGAFLSGGLDSSAVVAFAREVAPGLRCFTIDLAEGQEEGFVDDLPYARSVAQHLGVQLDVVRVDAARMAIDVEAMVHQLDEPLADPAALNVLYISRLARAHGMKVLLSGAGGDDLFTGYRRHLALGAERWWSWMPMGLRKGVPRMVAMTDKRGPLARRVERLAGAIAEDGDGAIVAHFKWISREHVRSLYAPEVREALSTAIAEMPMMEYLAALPQDATRLDRMLALEQRFFLADHNLTYTDKMSMAAGIEARVPFLDLDLVDLAARVPDHMKQRGRTGKWVLKEAMKPYLPPEVIHRPKTGFGAPLRRWMRGELKPLLRDVLSVSSLRRRGIFDAEAVQRLIADNDRGRIDGSYPLLAVLSIELWCRAFVDPPHNPRSSTPTFAA